MSSHVAAGKLGAAGAVVASTRDGRSNIRWVNSVGVRGLVVGGRSGRLLDHGVRVAWVEAGLGLGWEAHDRLAHGGGTGLKRPQLLLLALFHLRQDLLLLLLEGVLLLLELLLQLEMLDLALHGLNLGLLKLDDTLAMITDRGEVGCRRNWNACV